MFKFFSTVLAYVFLVLTFVGAVAIDVPLDPSTVPPKTKAKVTLPDTRPRAESVAPPALIPAQTSTPVEPDTDAVPAVEPAPATSPETALPAPVAPETYTVCTATVDWRTREANLWEDTIDAEGNVLDYRQFDRVPFDSIPSDCRVDNPTPPVSVEWASPSDDGTSWETHVVCTDPDPSTPESTYVCDAEDGWVWSSGINPDAP